MSLPTTVNVQLLGHGNVVLFSVSATPEMSVNFVVSDDELVRVLKHLTHLANNFPNSALRNISISSEEK